jgi:DNA-binding PadR family transcriptional regulator
MERPEAYPITYAVLGLLAFMGPMSGYDIKRLFDHILSPMWGAAHSQIYNELRRMKTLGWVEMQREEQEARPDRNVYRISEQGQEALTAWQTQSPGVYQLRDELLLKVLFGTFAPTDALVTNLKHSIIAHEQRLASYRQNLQYIPARGAQIREGVRPNPYASEGEGDVFFELVAHFAIDLEKTYLRWLYEALDFVEGRTREHTPLGDEQAHGGQAVDSEWDQGIEQQKE